MQDTIFLHGPSREDASRIGLVSWYDWLAGLECVEVIGRLEDISKSGIFVSFKPIQSYAGTFPELRGRVERWLALDDSRCIAASCLLAEQSDVERVFHARLPDEMLPYCPVPATLSFLQRHGMWLPPRPPAFKRSRSASNGTANLLLVANSDRDAGDDRTGRSTAGAFQITLDEVARQLRWSVESASFENLADEAAGRGACAAIARGDIPHDELLTLVHDCSAASIAFCVTNPFSFSPIRFSLFGLRPPQLVLEDRNSLRAIAARLIRFLQQAATRTSELAPSSTLAWDAESVDSAFLGAVRNRCSKPFEPAVVGDFLVSEDGLLYLERVARTCRQFGAWTTPAYLALEFYRQHPPFRLLTRDSIPAELTHGLEKLADALIASIAAYSGKKNMHLQLATWTLALLGKYEESLKLLRESDPFDFTTCAEMTANLSLALLYRRERAAAQACLAIPNERKVGTDNTVAPAGYNAMLQYISGGAERANYCPENSDLATRLALALLAERCGSELDKNDAWGRVRQLDSDVADAFAAHARDGTPA